MKLQPSSRMLIASGTTLLILLASAVWIFGSGHGAEMFMPHAHCYLFNQELMLLHGLSDFFIGLAYVAISSTLTYVVIRARRELPFHWMMLAFALFIVACGGTHFMELWTLKAERPPYWLSGWVKLITALASVTTAVLLPPLIPRILALLQAMRTADERRQELEHAYSELEALYQRAIQPAPKKERIAAQFTPPPAATAKPEDFATLAREVGVHTMQLERAKEEAESANQAKDQFLAVLSHELRTPLTPALAAASNLENAENIDPVELRESLGIIRRNIELEARLVDDLLDLTRISKGKLQIHLSTINLHETIRHAAEMCRSEAHHKGNDLSLGLDATDYHVRGDGARLAQVFWNLMLNAVKFTPAEGKIRVRTFNPAPGSVTIEVNDTGIGIDPDMLTRVFEPFQQGDQGHTRRYGGLGLGLSVAQGLVRAHGGTISAHSRGKGQGATFRIEIATTTPPAAPKVAPRSLATNHELHQPHLRILLAEDHDDTRQALERLLKRWGHDVRTASTLAEAVGIAAEFHPELLLSDIGLPDGTGIDLLGKLRDQPGLKAIAMSGYGMEADLELTRHAGFIEHLIKPVSAERLKEALVLFLSKDK